MSVPPAGPLQDTEASSYGIAASLVPVRVVLRWGEAVSGGLFLRDAPSPSEERESLGGRLNDPETHFVPFERDGRVEFIRLGAVAYVEHAGELPEIRSLRELGARFEPVELDLATGERLRGDLVGIAPPERSRLSDLLNRGGAFLPLVAPGTTVYVARRAIARVRPAA